jgi:hypothetical protein
MANLMATFSLFLASASGELLPPLRIWSGSLFFAADAPVAKSPFVVIFLHRMNFGCGNSAFTPDDENDSFGPNKTWEMKKPPFPPTAVAVMQMENTSLPSVEAKLGQRQMQQLKGAMGAAHRLPTVFELAQITAALNGNENWRKFVPDGLGDWPEESVAKSALGLWQQCREVVLTALMMEQFEIAGREAKRKANSSAWETALRKVKFPLEFDQALKLIMGEKTRRADRYKLFRHFLQENHGSWIEQKSDVGFEAEEIFTTFKAEGFGKIDLQICADQYSEWKARQSKAKARKAAQKRWASKIK